MPLVDAVLFDLDDTLVSYRRSGAELIELGFDRVGAEQFFTVDEYHARYDEHLGAIDDMDAFREECFARIAEAKGEDVEVAREVARVFAEERDQRNVELLPGAREAVEALADDYTLALVTNGPPGMQRAKLSVTGVADRFEEFVFAGFDETRPKPDPQPFDEVLDRLGVPPERAVHVGNSTTTDVAGAHEAGVGAAWLRQDGEVPDPEPDYVLDSLEDLVAPPWE